MESLYPIALRIIAGVAIIYFGLGLFNVPWLLRVRILAALGAGALIVGGIGWPLVRPDDPLCPVTLFTGEISMIDAAFLVALGFSAGVVATLICYPMGNILGPFAAPAGVAVLALTTPASLYEANTNYGTMRQLLAMNSSFEQRNVLYSTMRWELLFWLIICGAGYLGVMLTTRLIHTKTLIIEGHHPPEHNKKSSGFWINAGIAAFATAIIVYFSIGIFAQDLRQVDDKLGFVLGQPGKGQIAFGVFVSVGLAAFAMKRFFQGYYLPVIAGAAILYLAMYTKIVGSSILQDICQTHPVDFFSHTLYAIIPIQYAPFGCLGALTGYWIAVRTLQKSDEIE